MAKDTKQRIIDAALDMFAQNGYAGTNIRELSGSLELGKSSLYRHFESKEELWDAVYEQMRSHYEAGFGSADHIAHIPQTTDELYDMTMHMVDFTVHDEKIVKLRRLILTEQFRDERFCKFATRYFMDDTKAIFEKVFSAMMEKGVIRKCNADFLAFSYTAPITELIHLCDREPAQIGQTVSKIEGFVKEFINQYEVKA